MRHRLFLFLIVAGAVLFAPSDARAAKFVAGLSSYKVTTRPGQVLTHPYQLTLDKAEQPTRFKFRVEDFWRSEDGMQSFYAGPGTLKRSCGRWVTVNPVEALAQPGVTLTTRLTINVPAEAEPGGYWCVLTVDEVPDPLSLPTGVGAQFMASVSTGIFIYIEPVQRSIQFEDVQIGGTEASMRLLNNGNAPVAIEGRFEFFRPGETQPIAVAELARATLLPEPVPTGIFRAPLPPPSVLPSGRYMVRAIVDIGLDHYIGVERQLELTRDAPLLQAP